MSVGAIFVRRLPSTTKWKYDHINNRLNVYGSDPASDLGLVRKRIINGEIRSDLDAIVYRGVFVIRGQHLKNWIAGYPPDDDNY